MYECIHIHNVCLSRTVFVDVVIVIQYSSQFFLPRKFLVITTPTCNRIIIQNDNFDKTETY